MKELGAKEEEQPMQEGKDKQPVGEEGCVTAVHTEEGTKAARRPITSPTRA